MKIARPQWLGLDLPQNSAEIEAEVAGEWGKLEADGGWISNGGPARSHPHRAFPFSVELPFEGVLEVRSLVLVGAFAMFSGLDAESLGTYGASISLTSGREDVTRHELRNGRHYVDATILDPIAFQPGDGVTVRTLGTGKLGGVEVRIDEVRIDWLESVAADAIRFRDLGSPASFILLGAWTAIEQANRCPFHAHSGGVALGEIGAIIRMADRARMQLALGQLRDSLARTEDLDEARGEALTFLAMVTAATLEMGGTREMHRMQLEAARLLDRLDDAASIAATTEEFVISATPFLRVEGHSPNDRLVQTALSYVDKHFARNLTDATVASDLGLSTSHFRFLFRQATGQPFHRYLINLRLEKARKMLMDESNASVGEIAMAVGFRSLPHFSRAFTQRFQMNPTSIREGIR